GAATGIPTLTGASGAPGHTGGLRRRNGYQRLVEDGGGLGVVAINDDAEQIAFLDGGIDHRQLAKLCRIELALQIGQLSGIAAGSEQCRQEHRGTHKTDSGYLHVFIYLPANDRLDLSMKAT